MKKQETAIFMCFTVPAQIIKLNGQLATVRDHRGRVREINVGAVKNPRAKNWLLCHADLAVAKLSAREARNLVQLLKK